MKILLDEILAMPEQAEICYEKNQNILLPSGVPYLGMGSSYNAASVLSYCGVRIYPYPSSAYYYYIGKELLPLGVLISQSGETSETLWCSEFFEHIIALTNQPQSPLANLQNAQEMIQLYAGQEESSSTKTFLNTLIALYIGLGIDPRPGLQELSTNFNNFQQVGMRNAQKIYDQSRLRGLYILGSGPNSATAAQGALVLSEVTKLAWTGMSVAQYDHGPKETANDTAVILLNANGRDAKRISLLKKNLKKHSNAFIIELTENRLSEELSPITLIAQLNFLTNYLAEYMKIEETYQIGGKITRVMEAEK